MLKLIVLDRDGVINYDSPDYIKTLDEWQAIDGSLLAIAKLSQAGYRIAIATNQSGIARKYFSVATLEAMHLKMLNEVKKMGGKIEAIFTCMHLPDAGCDCRKPKPGMLIQASQYFNVSAEEMIFIGDSQKDLEAAQSFACPFILIGEAKNMQNTTGAKNLAQAAQMIIQRKGEQ